MIIIVFQKKFNVSHTIHNSNTDNDHQILVNYSWADLETFSFVFFSRIDIKRFQKIFHLPIVEMVDLMINCGHVQVVVKNLNILARTKIHSIISAFTKIFLFNSFRLIKPSLRVKYWNQHHNNVWWNLSSLGIVWLNYFFLIDQQDNDLTKIFS
jgi:hypothetical protein